MLRLSKLAQVAVRYNRPMPWQMDSLLDIGSREIFTDEHDKACGETHKIELLGHMINIDVNSSFWNF